MAGRETWRRWEGQSPKKKKGGEKRGFQKNTFKSEFKPWGVGVKRNCFRGKTNLAVGFGEGVQSKH